MDKIVECVPNFSEGCDTETLDAISDAVRHTEGATLLDVDPGKTTNRTVFTFVGSPTSIVEAALNAARVARERIDMRRHKGAHPRCGAMDVCPFVPVANVTMEECVAISKVFGRRLAETLNVPVFLYEEACEKGDYRKSLRQIRSGGEYEGMEAKLKLPEWEPDFGPAEFVPEWGVTSTGARFFLVAYNVNLLCTKEQAVRIAMNIREGGRGASQPGRCRAVKGGGWFIDDFNVAQVTMNLDNYNITPPHVVFEEAKKDAEELNLPVIGSEIVGMVPLEAILMAAEYYIKKENLFILDEKQKVMLAVQRLGLSSVSPFDPEKRIIEYVVKGDSVGPLASMSVQSFVSSVAARLAAPGGGSVSALAGSLGMGLAQMTGLLTFGRRKWEDLDSQMRKCIPPLYEKVDELIRQIDQDSDAFAEYMKAMKLPKSTDEEVKAREEAMQSGLKNAVEVPLRTMRFAGDKNAWESIITLAEVGNLNCRSDLEVGVKMLETAVFGAHRNVLINLKDLCDPEFVEKITKETNDIVEFVGKNVMKVLTTLDGRKE